MADAEPDTSEGTDSRRPPGRHRSQAPFVACTHGMSDAVVTVAIPVRNGAAVLDRTLQAVRAQRLDADRAIELLVCDSGSRDGSVEIARRYGAELFAIAPETFSHGGTRNLLMERASGAHVAFLTQDAVPADERWLQRLLDGFGLAARVGLVYGPYLPQPDASVMVARELTEWFASLSPAGSARIDRLDGRETGIASRSLLGARGYFTDANGAVARAAWEEVRFRKVAYAEDHALAHDMLRAGYAKVYLPDAAVIHSHEYSALGWMRRSFDEARAVHEMYGYVEPLAIRRNALKLWGSVGGDWRWARRAGTSDPLLLARSTNHHLLRLLGAILGGRSRQLPASMARSLSLEDRAR